MPKDLVTLTQHKTSPFVFDLQNVHRLAELIVSLLFDRHSRTVMSICHPLITNCVSLTPALYVSVCVRTCARVCVCVNPSLFE